MSTPGPSAELRTTRRGEAALLAGVVVLLLVAGTWSLTLSRQAMLLPLLTVGIGLPVTLGRLYWLFSGRGQAGDGGYPAGEVDARRLLRSAAWALGLLAAAALAGFYVAVPVFVASYLERAGQRRWVSLVAAGAALGVCYLFQRFLMIDMHIGLLP